jgi:lysophospholipase L1-like esterase
METHSLSPFTTADINVSQTQPIRIVLIGDSTVCNYDSTRPDRGWGQFLEEKFPQGSVEVINLAASGRSTKTFMAEGRWAKALKENPHFVLIQFGHNDSHAPENPESTDANTTYKEFLRCYVDDSRALGASPILVTPMVRRTFNAQGQLEDSLLPYANAMKAVGKEKGADVIDLHTSSAELISQLGPKASSKMANVEGDRIHFNELGARKMAELVMINLTTIVKISGEALNA